MKLGKLAAWTIFSTFDARNGAAFAQRIEHWGYDALWIPEAFGRDPLIGASWILANTTKLNVATGIANIYARDSLATVNAQYALAEQSEDRFLLGVGVSHIPLVEGVRRHKYEKPIAGRVAPANSTDRKRRQAEAVREEGARRCWPQVSGPTEPMVRPLPPGAERRTKAQ